MNPINIKTSSPSSQVSTNPPVGNPVLPPANPIPLQTGSLGMAVHDQRNASGLKNKNQDFLSIAQDKNQTGDDRISAAYQIDDQSLRDQAFLAIAKDKSIDYMEREHAIRSLSPEARDKMFLEIAKDSNTNHMERQFAIDSLSPEARDKMFFEIAKDSNTNDIEREGAIYSLSTEAKRDEAWIARATNPNLGIIDRVDAAFKISHANSAIKDELLLKIAQDNKIDHFELELAINSLSSQAKRDEAWIARATNPNLGIMDRIDAAIKISADDHTILRNTMLIQLYNEALNQGQGQVELEMIVDAIQDPHLQAVAREALEAGGPVRLGSTKSARNVQE